MPKNKKKPQKSNIVKKQQRKKQLKSQVRAKNKVSAPRKKQVSVSQLKKLLHKLPILVFDENIRNLRFPAAAIEEATKVNEALPFQIAALYTEEFHARFYEALQTALKQANQQNKQLLIQTLLYYLDNEEHIAPANHLIVALYYDSIKPFETEDQAIIAVKAYEEEWGEFIQENFETQEGNEAETADLEAQVAQPSVEGTQSIWQEISAAFLATLDSTIQENQFIEDDLDTFLYDYCQSQELKEPSDLSKLKVRRFITQWFPEQISPNEEDKQQVTTSLLHFFTFIQTSAFAEKMDASVLTDIIQFLTD